MADPVTPDADTLLATGQAAEYAQTAFTNFGSAAEGARSILDNFNNKVTQLKTSLDANQNLTQQQTTAFGLLTNMVIGTRKAFDNLAGVDTSSLNTFSSQINDLQRTILEDKSLVNMGQRTAALAASLQSMGGPVGTITELAKQGFGALANYANSLAESADNGLRLQNAYIQLSAATGNLNDVYSAAGPNLGKINLLLSQQQKLITDSSTATGVSAETVSQYYAQLASVPKALTSNIVGISGVTEKTSMLTAVMRFATGSGRSFSDVVDDMRVAFRNYNITGQEALTFTARIGEISNKFGIEMVEVRETLRSTSDQFKIFGNEAEGAANIYNSYLGALQSTGISGSAAIDVVKGMVGGIKELGIAQKGFLSAQTGGPGGLMGAFQIEKELREGKIDKVFDKVRQSLGKQFGNIVSLEEASQSQAAAAQLTKQIQILRQGALGSFAKDDQSAIRILESFKAREQGKSVPGELSQSIVQDTAKAGLDIEQKSYTELSRIRSLIEAARGGANISNLGFLQGSLAAGTGTPTVSGEASSQLRDDLTQNMQQGAKESGATAIEYSNGLVNKFVKDKSGQFAYQLIDNFGKFYDQLGPAIKAPVENIKELFAAGDSAGATRTYQDYLARLDEEKEAAMTLATAAKEEQLKQIATDRENYIQAYSYLNNSSRGTAGSQVGVAVNTAANVKNIAPSSNSITPAAYNTTPQRSGGNMGDLTVHVEGYCISCGDKMKNTAQSFAVNVAQRVEK